MQIPGTATETHRSLSIRTPVLVGASVTKRLTSRYNRIRLATNSTEPAERDRIAIVSASRQSVTKRSAELLYRLPRQNYNQHVPLYTDAVGLQYLSKLEKISKHATTRQF